MAEQKMLEQLQQQQRERAEEQNENATVAKKQQPIDEYMQLQEQRKRDLQLLNDMKRRQKELQLREQQKKQTRQESQESQETQESDTSSSRSTSGYWQQEALRSCGSCRLVCVWLSLLIGFLLIAAVLPLQIAAPLLIRSRLAAQLPLVNGSESFASWQSEQPEIRLQLWLFNITNPGDFASGQQPQLQQVGPLTYEVQRVRRHAQFSGDSRRLLYREAKFYRFLPSESCCSQDSQVYQLQLDAASGKYSAIALSASHWLWGPSQGNSSSRMSRRRSTVGVFADKNGTFGAEFVISTGSQDAGSIGRIVSWDGRRNLSWWETETANRINGTDGTQFGVGVDCSSDLFVFSGDICRSIQLRCVGERRLHGVKLLRFRTAPELFANATLNPDNRGFCVDGRCLDSGVLNVSKCRQGAPVLMSQPHLYQAAEAYRSAVGGLLPPSEEFATVLDVEPNTGVVMSAAKKLQVNYAVASKNLILPFVWFNESSTAKQQAVGQLHNRVTVPLRFARKLLLSMLISGLLTVFASFIGLKFLM